MNFQKILIIASLSMVLSLIIVSLTSITYIKIIEGQSKCAGLDDKPIISSSDFLKSGTVGNIKVSDTAANTVPQKGALPAIIFGTSGTITEIKDSGLAIAGDGSNFEDGIPRSLDVIFTPQTITFNSLDQNKQYRGLNGLVYLKIGNKILIDAIENIHGKTEFKASTINLVK